MRVRRGLAALAIALIVSVGVPAPHARAQGVAPAQSRGALLYDNHCIACHNTQMHWRDRRLAQDWNSLQALVRRWQATALLQWSEDDILEVTRYLNERIYRFVPPPRSVGSTGTGLLASLSSAQPP